MLTGKDKNIGGGVADFLLLLCGATDSSGLMSMPFPY